MVIDMRIRRLRGVIQLTAATRVPMDHSILNTWNLKNAVQHKHFLFD